MNPRSAWATQPDSISKTKHTRKNRFFNKGAKITQRVKNNLLNKWCWEKNDIYIPKNKESTLIKKLTQNGSNSKAKTIKLSEKNIQEKLLDTEFGKNFLDRTSKAQATKAKVDKWDNSKM